MQCDGYTYTHTYTCVCVCVWSPVTSRYRTLYNIPTVFFLVHSGQYRPSVQFSSVQSLSHVWLFETPWTTACQASLCITKSRSSPKLMSIESVMPSNHSWGWALHKWDKCPCKRDPRVFPWPFCCVRTQPRQPSMNQEEGSHQTLNLLAPWSSPSQAPEFREINVHCLSHPFYGIFVIAAGQQ